MQEKTQWMKYYLEYCRKQKNLSDKTFKAFRIVFGKIEIEQKGAKM